MYVLVGVFDDGVSGGYFEAEDIDRGRGISSADFFEEVIRKCR